MTWLPMNTAPKDGTRILINISGSQYVAWWVSETAEWQGYDGLAVADFVVTGWRPLSFIPASVVPPPEGHDLIVKVDQWAAVAYYQSEGKWKTVSGIVITVDQIHYWALVPGTEESDV